MTVPARKLSPTLRGCHTLLPVVKRACPLIRTTLALSWVAFCAKALAAKESATTPATSPVIKRELFFISFGLLRGSFQILLEILRSYPVLSMVIVVKQVARLFAHNRLCSGRESCVF